MYDGVLHIVNTVLPGSGTIKCRSKEWGLTPMLGFHIRDGGEDLDVGVDALVELVEG